VTSFVSWLGADSRGPTSIYFASDSRISWGNDPLAWDTGRKLFACRESPEMFGFTGYVLLPQSVLTRASDFIDRRIWSSLALSSPAERAAKLAEITRIEVRSHARPLAGDFSLFYAARSGEGMPDRCSFQLFQVHCSAGSREVTVHRVLVPTASSVLRTHGTGAESVNHWVARWHASDQGGTSRAVFSAFCDSLRAKQDARSGGEPQLIGLYRHKNAQVFGVVTERGPSFEGILGVEVPRQAGIEWRDEAFQRVKSDGSLLKAAQPHARPDQLR
jgi:hypothetical protein